MTAIFHPSTGWSLPSNEPALMGIVNVTPDSFSDGKKAPPAFFVEKALQLIDDGAHIIDIGGESTRPGSIEISDNEELDRILPVVEELAKRTPIPLSIDTRKAKVAEAGLRAGALIINDVSGFRFDPQMAEILKCHRPGVIAMHSRSTPQTMREAPHTVYRDLVFDVIAELRETLDRLLSWGLDQNLICLDPGFGFAKTKEQSLELLLELERFKKYLDTPFLIGLSRKAFLGAISGEKNAANRDPETLAALAIAYQKGFRFFRVHEVSACRRFFSVRMVDGPGRSC